MSSAFYNALLVVCSHLSYPEMTVIVKLSVRARSVVGAVMARRVNKLMELWMDPSDRVWSILEDARAIIAGSFVLRLLDDSPDRWPPGSLDIYLPEESDNAPLLMRFFRRVGHYTSWTTETFEPVVRPVCRDYPMSAEELVVSGFHEGERLSDGQTVRLFLVSTDEPLDAVPNTWSTAHVNFITTDTLVCAYPRATLRQRGFFPASQWRMMDHYALYVMMLRGYHMHPYGTLRSDGTEKDDESQYDPRAPRSLGDSQCLRLPIDRRALSPVESLGPVYPSVELADTITWTFGASFSHILSPSNAYTTCISALRNSVR